MIRQCTGADFNAIETIVNDGAAAYRGAIPDDCLHDPYMSAAELRSEIAAGVDFWGWQESGELLGVMGIQRVRDSELIRHAYVRTSAQGKGIGQKLLESLIERSTAQLLVGTWAAAVWAIRFYEKHGFQLVAGEDKDRLLDTYWRISPRQRETSVVLRYAARERA